MPIASDSTTGTREDVDRDIIAAAAAGTTRGSGPTRQSASPIIQQGDHLRGPSHPSNSSGHSNPVPSMLYGPGRESAIEKLIVDDLAMKTGALTTVEGVEDYSFKMPSRDETVRKEVAEATGLRGQALDMALGYRAQQEQETGRKAQTSAEEAREMSQAERAFKSGIRATRRGVNQGGSLERVKALTSEEYAAMSPQQKAAVELNSMLVEAVKADMAIPKNHRKVEDSYRDAVEKIFTGEGAEASKKNYAPNTVAILSDIGWSATATDLEDVLSGKLGFTRQDIKDLGPEREGVAPDASLNTAEKLRDEIQASLVKAFTAARKEPIQGQNLLGAKQELLDYDKMPGFSTKPSRVVYSGPDGDVDVNAFFRSGFDLLANSNSEYTAEEILADARANLNDKEFQQFLNFVDINSRDAKKFRQPLGSTEGTTYFDPVEFRKEIAKTLRGAR